MKQINLSKDERVLEKYLQEEHNSSLSYRISFYVDTRFELKTASDGESTITLSRFSVNYSNSLFLA